MIKIFNFSLSCSAASAIGATISFIVFSISESLIKADELNEIDNKKNNNNKTFSYRLIVYFFFIFYV